MIKYMVIGLIIIIGLFDYALLVACSRLEDRESYQEYDRWKERQKGKNDE